MSQKEKCFANDKTRKSYEILVVEDDEGLCYLIQRNLRREGFDVIGVMTGAEAIEQAIRNPDMLFLLDYKLPDMTGKQVIEHLALRQVKVPFIIMSGHGDERVAVEMMKLGAYDYMVKDDEFLDLLPSVVNRIKGQLETEKRLREAEEALRESEEKYRSIFETAPNLIASVDANGIILDCNNRVVKLLGYSPEELIGQPIDKIIYPSDIAKARESLKETFDKGATYDKEYKMLRKDGGIIDVSICSSALRDDEKVKYARVSCVVEDITERKRTGEEIRRLTQFLESIIDNADVWLYVLDSEGNVVIWNKTAEKISGYSRDEVIGGDKFWQLLYPDDNFRKETASAINEAIEKYGVLEDYETTVYCKNGENRIISWNFRNLLDSSEIPVWSIALGRDVTRQKEIDEAKSAFISLVSHEIRTPLTAIRNVASSIELAGEINEQQRKLLSIAVRNIDRLTGLVNRILDFSKLEAGKTETDFTFVDLKSLAGESISTMRSIAGDKYIKIIDRIPDNLPQIYADRQGIEQVFTNLIENAVKFTPENGQITIEARLKDDNQGETALGFVEVSISDTGIGIAPENQKRIFEKFERASSQKTGVGLGLSIVKKIIDDHKGEIWVESEMGKGSKFIFTMPMQKFP